MAINVILVDGQALVADGLNHLLENAPDIAVVGKGYDADAAVSLTQEHQPDVLVLDAEMPGPKPHDTIQRVLELSPSTRIVILTSNGDPLLARTLIALSPQVRAYLVKDIPAAPFIETVRIVTRDTQTVVASSVRSLDQALDRLTASSREVPELTGREREVLVLAAEGLTNPQIADRLFISRGTVNNHLSAVYFKLSASNRIDAINRAARAGLIPDRGADG